MKRTFAILLALALLPLSACADAKAPLKSADPALWLVEDADTTVYLFGTVHMLKPGGAPWFDDEVKAAFDRSGELVTEVGHIDPATMATEVGKLALNKQGPPITQMLEQKERIKYLKALEDNRDALEDNGISPEKMDLFDPWLAAINLSIAPLRKLGYSQDAGSEAVLEKAARISGKQLSGLETVPQQLGYFDALPRPLQIAFLNDTVDELPGLEKQFARLVADWERGRADALGRETNRSLEKTPEVARVLLYERNARWAQWTKARMARPGVVFVAVGAGHLAGPQSVQEKLAALGLNVRRVKRDEFVAAR